jgi:pantoate kinase
MLVYLTVHPIPADHIPYLLVDTDGAKMSGSHDIHSLNTSDMTTMSAIEQYWDLGCKTLDEFLAHPNVIQFTEDSHPEYFV